MHRTALPPSAVDRVISRRGRAHPFDDLDPTRTALVVIDMQNGFMEPGVAHALCAHAPDIVPAINRLAGSLRRAGGQVFWVQNTHTDACLADWSVMYDALVPAARAKRIEAMTRGSRGHALWSELDVRPADTIVEKRRYSAFIEASSDLAERLRERGLDTVLIAGTVTNTCCESSARDAMMMNFKTVMVADGCAAHSDEEHNASLTAFYLVFGDVMSVDELEASFGRAASKPKG